MSRYAIYFVPAADSALWRFGCGAIGYDSAAACDAPFHDHAFFAAPEIREWTADPRRYGFHATLKPPFVLRAGQDVGGLAAAAASFAAARKPFTVARMEVRAIGGFLALVPASASMALNDLAAACVREFEPFRAPLTEADMARRLKNPLTPNQRANLDRWGYPYVFDEFRFHMTLTGRLPEAAREPARAALAELYGPISAPLRFDAISLCEQPHRDARFVVRERFGFGQQRA